MALLYIGLAVAFLAVFIYALRQKDDSEHPFSHPYLLDDSNFARNDAGECRDRRVEEWFGPGQKYSGYAIAGFPREAELRSLNLTTPPGGTTGMMISLMFQLGKWEWLGRMKIDEWIEVSPTFAQYYQITLRQREELETRIKQGLASAAQAVSDLELLKHDQRKYREFLEYFGLEFNDDTRKWKETGKKDEHSLRAMFIDLVDAHTGDMSMRTIVQRWPTLIVDFQKLADADIEPDKIKSNLDVSKAEAVVLSTKNRLYVQWKRMFEPEVKARYERIFELVRSRQRSVEEYRNWLKPLVARHKMLEEGLTSSGSRRDIRFEGGVAATMMTGTATAWANIKYWAWHWVTLPELEKGGTERLAIENAEGFQGKIDEWTKRELIFHEKHGLIVKHPWITEKWVDKMVTEIWKRNWLRQEKVYYAFVIIEFIRSNMRSASGGEVEDTVFAVNSALFSRNVMIVKILEFLAKEEEFDRYVDDLLGVPYEKAYAPPEPKEYEIKNRFAKFKKASSHFLDFFLLNRFQFMKHGPYERDFRERLTKYWFRTMSQGRYEPIVRFLKDKIGMGVN